MVFVSKKIIGLTFFILISYLVFDFVQKKEEDFWQFNYDWSQIKTEQKLGEVAIDSVGVNFLNISTSDIVNPINVNTIMLEEDNKKYYFNFENTYIKNQQIKFTGGFWLLNEPINKQKNIRAELVKLPLKQTGNLKVNLIVDSQLLWRGGRNFRKWLKEKNTNINFVGNKVDLYGYPYSGEILNNSQTVLNSINEIPKANIYIISLGTHESSITINETITNFEKIIDHLLQQSDFTKVYVVNVPPALEEKRNEYNKNLNKSLARFDTLEKVEIIDFYQMINNDYKALLTKDKIHYQNEAYKLLANYINEQIKDEE